MKIKKIYKYTIKPIINLVTFRYFRKIISKKIYGIINAKKIEKMIPDNSVIILQHQFYDKCGENCFNGGAERYVKDLAFLIKEHGACVLLQMGNKEIWTKQVENMLVIGVPASDISAYEETIKHIKKYQLIIYSGMVPWGKEMLHPNIMISHGVTWDNPSKDVNVNKIYNIIKDVDEIISVDINTISWLRSTYAKSLKNKKMRVIPNYVDTKSYKPVVKNSNNIKILFPRRCCSERGYWLVSKILPEIINKYKNIEIDLVGYAHGEKIASDIKRLANMFPNKINHYVVSPEKMSEIYSKADISLIPTMYSEGTSLSCLEAMSTGNAVIATNIGGLGNLVIDGYNGILINPEEKELLQALDVLLSNDEYRKTIQSNAVKIAKSFDKTIWEDRWKEVFANHINKDKVN